MVMMAVSALPFGLGMMVPVNAEQLPTNNARKVLGSTCVSCHGKTNPAGNIDLSSDSGIQIAVTSGRLERVLKAGSMPPNKRLAKQDESALRTLLPKTSAAPALWSLRPVSNPAIPKMSGAKHPVDAFILKGLKAKGISVNPPATQVAWLRRITVDLTGLPPTAAESSTFLADKSANARQKVVDRLLASPAYGERMARLWLDVARFGESHGYEQNHIRANAWPYRDYVIRSFNADKPYADFIQEQLAGDVLGRGNPDILPATGFLVAGIHDTVPSQVEEATRQQRANDLEDIVATVGASVMGFTIGCARCHDHKFDPFSQRDFYWMWLKPVFSRVMVY
jgi:cytochrome c553